MHVCIYSPKGPFQGERVGALAIAAVPAACHEGAIVVGLEVVHVDCGVVLSPFLFRLFFTAPGSPSALKVSSENLSFLGAGGEYPSAGVELCGGVLGCGR